MVSHVKLALLAHSIWKKRTLKAAQNASVLESLTNAEALTGEKLRYFASNL